MRKDLCHVTKHIKENSSIERGIITRRTSKKKMENNSNFSLRKKINTVEWIYLII